MYTTSKYGGAAVDVGGSVTSSQIWINPSYAAGAPDSNSASISNLYPNATTSSSIQSDNLNITGFAMAIPSTAVIKGVIVTFTRTITPSSRAYQQAAILTADGRTGALTESGNVFGDKASTGGLTLTPADVNAAGFGVQTNLYTNDPNQGITLTIDAVQIVVYWDYPAIAQGTIGKTHVYQMFRQGAYLGILPEVTSEFAFAQNINTAGTSIKVVCAVSADTSALPIPTLDDENGVPLQTEAGDTLTVEAYPDIVGNNNSGALFRNGNQLIVYEYSNYYPNGKQVFSGDVEKWGASYGGAKGDSIMLTAYSDGSELNNFIVTGGDVLDQSQTAQNTSLNLSDASNSWNKYGQTFTVGSGVGNVEGVSILTLGGATIYASIYNSVADANTGVAPLASTSIVVPTYATPTEVKFVFSPIVTKPAGSVLFLALDTNAANGMAIYQQSTDVYSGGTAYNSSYSGGSGGGSWGAIAGDLWFKTFYGGNGTVQTYTNSDPTNMLLDAVARYNSKGGVIQIGSTDLTNLSLTYTFKVATLFEAINVMLALAPYNFYWYVDIGSDLLYFKKTATTPKFTFIKGKHITGLNLSASTENVKNTVYFTGGTPSGATTNLFSAYTDLVSIQSNKQRLDRKTDNRVTIQATLDALGNSLVAQQKNENYETSVTVLDTTVDITLFSVGDVVGLGGFGNFIDNLLLQVVRIEKSPKEAVLFLGQLPPRVNQTIKDLQQQITNLNTLANPATPS